MDSATATVINSTFYDNNAGYNGGAFHNQYSGVLTVTNSTFSGNSAPSGGGVIYNGSATATFYNSILANSSSGGNCTTLDGSSVPTDGGYNISSDATCSFGGTSKNSTNPLLDPNGLESNGGPTQTIALEATSPAIDAVPYTSCVTPADVQLTTDQRGYTRPGFPGQTSCDIGAFEYTPLIVNTTLDDSTSHDGLCSLRKAINNSNSFGTDTTGGDCIVAADIDTILFSVSGTITLGSSLPAIQKTLTIDGTGQSITIDGANFYQILTAYGTLNLNDLVIAHGNASSGGGAVLNEATLNATNVTFAGNSAASNDGGAIYNDLLSTANVTNCTFEGNSAYVYGGAIIDFPDSEMTITGSTFSDNGAGDAGGAIFADDDTLNVTNSTFSGNIAYGSSGGAIENAGTLTVLNSTFAGNSAFDEDGGGINNNLKATVTNTILAGNTGGNCGGGTVTDGGYNISDDTSCDASFSSPSQNSTNPELSTSGLQFNGGPTQTIALQAGPAIDAVPLTNLTCPATDQRGLPRPDPEPTPETACDIGAYESGENPSCTPPPADMTDWWPGEGNANDLLNGTNNGTASGGVTYTPGEVGDAFTFDGTGSVDFGDDTSLQISGSNFSLDAWVEFNALGTEMSIVRQNGQHVQF